MGLVNHPQWAYGACDMLGNLHTWAGKSLMSVLLALPGSWSMDMVWRNHDTCNDEM